MSVSASSITINDIHGNSKTDLLTVIPLSEEIEDPVYGPQADVRPAAIEAAGVEIRGMVDVLAQTVDPFTQLTEKLQRVVTYHTNHTYLYVNDKDNLSCCKTWFNFDEKKVLACITAQLDALKAYCKSDNNDAWKAMRLAPQFIAGLNAISANYGRYPSFQTGLAALATECQEFLNTDCALPEIRASWTLYDLFDLKTDSFPTDKVLNCLKRDYSDRLADLVITYCIGNVDVPTLKREVVQGCLIVLATNVKREDLTPERPFEYFRRAPNGRSLIDFFGIPLSHENFGVHPAFLKEQNTDTIEAQTIVNEMCVLADMESTLLWHPEDNFEMPDEVMLDQLNSLFINPYNAQLFHTDRYLSFLTAAATSLAYLQSCKHNPQDIEHKIRPLVYLIETIIEDHAEKMYKTNTGEYIGCWEKLKNTLNAALVDPQHDFMSYYRSLFAHPHQSIEKKRAVYESHKHVQPSEFLARKVGYWHRFYLTNDKYVDKEGLITAHAQCDFRLGALFHLSENGTMVLYEVKELIHEHGFVCQLCTPFDFQPYLNEKIPIPIKLVFQGTIDNPKSKERDLNFGGPGYKIWNERGGFLFIQNVDTIIKNVIEKNSEAQFSLEFIGHSLGGADAQNATTFFMELYSDEYYQLVHQDIKNHVSSINVHTFNPAGVSNESAERYNSTLKCAPKTFIRHHFVQMDIVEGTGDEQLGIDAENSNNVEVTEVHNLGAGIVGKHCLYAHTRTDTIIPRKILDPITDAQTFNNYRYGIGHSWTDLTKRAQDMLRERPIINIAYNSLFLWATSSIQNYLTPLRFFGTPIDRYFDQRTTAAKKEVWDSARTLWHGKQLLEQS